MRNTLFRVFVKCSQDSHACPSKPKSIKWKSQNQARQWLEIRQWHFYFLANAKGHNMEINLR
jgi:hypothetical protein